MLVIIMIKCGQKVFHWSPDHIFSERPLHNIKESQMLSISAMVTAFVEAMVPLINGMSYRLTNSILSKNYQFFASCTV